MQCIYQQCSAAALQPMPSAHTQQKSALYFSMQPPSQCQRAATAPSLQREPQPARPTAACEYQPCLARARSRVRQRQHCSSDSQQRSISPSITIAPPPAWRGAVVLSVLYPCVSVGPARVLHKHLDSLTLTLHCVDCAGMLRRGLLVCVPPLSTHCTSVTRLCCPNRCFLTPPKHDHSQAGGGTSKPPC